MEAAKEEGTEYPLRYYSDAVKNCATFEDALRYLHQPCPICFDEYPMNEVIYILWSNIECVLLLQMVVLPACGDSLCENCFRQYFEIATKEKPAKHFTCPLCDQPDLGKVDEVQELVAMVRRVRERKELREKG